MIEAIEFKNFKALRATVLPLGRFTLIVGANGSGKSSALQALVKIQSGASYARLVTAGVQASNVEVVVHWAAPYAEIITKAAFTPDGNWTRQHLQAGTNASINPSPRRQPLEDLIKRIRIYSLDPSVLATPVALAPQIELGANGTGLAGVLDRLRDEAPERFEALNAELGRWLPEYDRVLFDTPSPGARSLLLRTRHGKHPLPAAELSQGTMLALAILTLAYLPNPPPVIGLEEPDHGIHPRLLREVRDALYRLSYPESFGESRQPVQVIATTHSPYLLDLYREHPEEIVIAQKAGRDVVFQRLTDQPDLQEILGDAPLSEVWYSGILGGVPTGP